MDNLLFIGYELLAAFVPFLLLFLLLRKIQKKQGFVFSKGHLPIMLIFSLYIAGVYHFTGTGTIYDILRYQLELRYEQINLIPFSQDIDLTAYLLNILLFVPLGLLAPVLWQKMTRLPQIIGLAFSFTLLIEASQLLNNRQTDIDDIFMNLSGALIGFMFFKLWDVFTGSRFRINSPCSAELPLCIAVVFIGRFLFYNEMGLARLLYHF